MDVARELIMFSGLSLLDTSEMLRFLKTDMTSLMNKSSSSLFFVIENLDVLMFSPIIEMVTVRRAWSEESCQLWWIK